MKEWEYIAVSNLVKARIAATVASDILEAVDDKNAEHEASLRLQATSALRKLEDAFYAKIKNKVRE